LRKRKRSPIHDKSDVKKYVEALTDTVIADSLTLESGSTKETNLSFTAGVGVPVCEKEGRKRDKPSACYTTFE
jgi:hypothetical protein